VTVTPEFRQQADQIKARYPDARSAMMPLLYLVQAEEGHVSREGMRRVAEVLGLSTAEVEGVVTFYTMYHGPPCGRYVISVCTNLSCALNGAREVYREALRLCGEEAEHGVSADGLFTVHEEECLAACDAAPVVTVNHANYDRVTTERLGEIVQGVRDGRPPAPSRGPFPGDLSQTSLVLSGFELEEEGRAGA
jgi:NADH-quinone oxidoreductase subunit E